MSRTPEEIYEQIRDERTAGLDAGTPGRGATDQDRLAWYEQRVAMLRHRGELWDELREAIRAQDPLAPLWQFAAVGEAVSLANEHEFDLRERMQECQRRIAEAAR